MDKNRTNSINQKPDRNVMGYSPWAEGRGQRNYSDLYRWSIFNTIMRGLKNVSFEFESDGDEEKKPIAQGIISMLNVNTTTLAWCKWKYGFIVLERTSRGWCIPDYRRVKTDSNGCVVNFEDVWYSDTYRHDGKSDFDIIRNSLRYMDEVKNGEEYLTRNLGAFGILSGKDSMPITPKDKDNFLERLKTKIGITSDRMQFEIFQSPVNFQQVDFHLKDLALDEKLKEEVKAIAGYFGVPYDILPVSGQSTYANQEQAVKSFYANCISPIAEMLLEVGRYIIRREAGLLIPANNLTFEIDNVPELKDDRMAAVDYKIKVAQLVKAIKDAGIEADLSTYEKILAE